MSLSNDLISQFIKVTNDSTGKKEKTKTYATVVESNGVMYVQLDGSELITPVDTTNILHEGDRVIVDINDHNAVASGNISNPSVSGVELSQTEDTLRIEFKEGLEKLELAFQDGYHQGITRVSKDGIKVSHTGYGGYTEMTHSGFYLTNGAGNKVLQCTANGLVYTGTITASDIMSTDGTFKIDKNGNITGASLKSSKGDNFSIDENGIITASALAVEGDISTNTIICKDISNKAYPKTLTSTVKIDVSDSAADDSSECFNGAKFRTLQGAVSSMPSFLNGKVVNIHVWNNITGNVSLNYFVGGRIFIYLHGCTVYGSLNFYHNSAAIFVYGGADTSDTTKATIHPSTGVNAGNKTCSIYSNVSRYVGIYNLNVWASDNHVDGLTGDKVGVTTHGGNFMYCSNINIVNCNVGFRSYSGAHMHVNTSSGIASVYGFEAVTGGRISFANSNQSGGTTAATRTDSGGQILKNSCTFASGSATSGSGSASTTTTTTSKTFTSSSAQALQYAGTSSAFWRTDCKPKAGDWGYGAHTGWWFFGDDFEDMAGKNVSKIEITFTREKAGNYAATACNFYVHSYETQPSTKSPTYNTSRIASASVAASTTHTISITDSTIISRIKSAKGICTVPASQNSTNYSVFSGTMKVKFTYKG